MRFWGHFSLNLTERIDLRAADVPVTKSRGLQARQKDFPARTPANMSITAPEKEKRRRDTSLLPPTYLSLQQFKSKRTK